jgi:hypothetical protein
MLSAAAFDRKQLLSHSKNEFLDLVPLREVLP